MKRIGFIGEGDTEVKILDSEVKRIGFIGEGDTEVKILDSEMFKDYLHDLGIDCVGVFNGNGIDNIKSGNKAIYSYFKIFQDRNTDKVIVLMDLENDPCVTATKQACHKYDALQVEVITKKAFESWFLSDPIFIKNFFGVDFTYYKPENTNTLPYDEIRELSKFFGVNGPGSKVRLANKALRIGFNFTRCIDHPNCTSSNYLDNLLKSLH